MFKPFWNNRVQLVADHLWSPSHTQTFTPVPELCNQLFTANRLDNCSTGPQSDWQPSRLSEADPTTSANTSVVNDTKTFRTRKIRIYPDQEQRNILREWFDTCRFVRNQAMVAFELREMKLNNYKMRDRFVTKKTRKGAVNRNVEEWMENTPQSVREHSIRELVTNYKSAFANLKAGNTSHFQMGFKTKKQSMKCDSLGFQKQYMSYSDPSTAAIKEPPKKRPKKGGGTNGEGAASMRTQGFRIFPTLIKNPVRTSKDRFLKKWIDGDKPDADPTIMFDQGRWFICLPTLANINYEAMSKPAAALDPGTRKFQTIYSQRGITKVEFQKKRWGKLYMRLKETQAEMSKKGVSNARKRALHKQLWKVWHHIKDMRDDMHKKLVWTLLEKHGTIFLPEFESQELKLKNPGGRFRREVDILAHYKFKLRLLNSCALRPNQNKIILCNECYTSKTCGGCGNLNNIGSSETYVCQLCGYQADRDVNAARNIYLKNLV